MAKAPNLYHPKITRQSKVFCCLQVVNGLKQGKADVHVRRKVPRKVDILIRKLANQLVFLLLTLNIFDTFL